MRAIVGGVVLAAILAGGAAAQQAQPDWSKVEIKATDLGRRTWMLEGQGGNLTLIAGDDGAILVDSQFAPLHDKIRAKVAELAGQPVRYLVNTHLHGDHTGGNQAFWLAGATLVGHANLKASLAAGTTNALTGAKIPPAPAAALPKVTYGQRTTVSVKGRTVELVHMPLAHTKGDTAVRVRDADVLATGDIVSWGARYPNIDVGDGGDIDGMIAAVDGFLKMAGPKTKIVPGHGKLMTRADLAAYRQLLADARDAVGALKAAGRSEDEAVAARPLADVQARAGATDPQSATLVRLIYRSVG
ncbi:MBL fold metallo-hydrolase [Phenylobacterium sp. J367]|uniref:MBL fold metallo-hydrolase n=1 Tax=Phenylobacterium sp. J367 TaxID=2898435 RepID=UPI002150E677|nr:MBL fold metallo-hydrolase [Phenylobacterium sp. J367]MCR5878923.1 MBL fold metallo-hydrolase [Phenylobacterium sp. J367]